jgi:hypothetical protein
MSPIATSWYESATFWTIFIGALAGISGTALGAWMTNRYANPKHQLEFQWMTNTALLEAASGTSAMTLQYRGVPLAEPRIIDVNIENASKKDITASSFHADAPIEIFLDSKIIEVKGIGNWPSTSAPPGWSISPSGDRLLILPSLLTGGQEVTFSVIVDGPGDESKFRFIAPLTGVTPKHLPKEDATRSGPGRWVSVVAAVAVFLSAVTGIALYQSWGRLDDSYKDSETLYKHAYFLTRCAQTRNLNKSQREECEKIARDASDYLDTLRRK